jgi:TRAP-type C4-dicarboxylate transport system permease small subunit
MSRFFKVIQGISLGGESVGRIVLLVMMLLISADTIFRYVFHSPIDGTMELSEFFMIAIVYPSLAYAQHLKAHVRVELLVMRLSARGQTVLGLFTDTIGFILWLIIGWKGLDMAIRAWVLGDTTSGILPLPLFPAKILIPFGAALLCIQLLCDIYAKLRLLSGAEGPRPPIPDSKVISRMEL